MPGLLEQVVENQRELADQLIDGDYVRRRWYREPSFPARLSIAAPLGIYSVIPKSPTHSPSWNPSQSPVGASSEEGGDPGPSYETYSDITATAGTDPTATEDNSITLPDGYDALQVCVGVLDMDIAYVYLHVKCNSDPAKRLILTRHQTVLVRAVAGATISFSSQTRTGDSLTRSDEAVMLTVCATIEPDSLVTPSAVTGTANCDKAGPPVWVPSGTAHIVLDEENQTFQFDAASGRRIFHLIEKDAAGELSPIRDIIVPHNTAVVVQCRHREIYLANFTGTSAAITAPTGASIGGTSTTHRPSFTVVREVPVSTAAGLAAALATGTVADGDDIILAAGTYTLSTSGHQINSTNFGGSASTAMGKSIRIRGATGTATDVTVNGAGWRIVMQVGARWVVESMFLDMDGLAPQSGGTGVVDITGRVDLHNIRVEGPSSTTTAPNVAYRSSSTLGTIVNYMTFCTLVNTAEDNLDLDNSSGDLTVYVIGGTYDGNDSGASDQVLTSHTGSKLYVMGAIITDASQSSNALKVAADSSSSKLYLHYCRCLSTDVAHAKGVQFTATHGIDGIYMCNFGAIYRALVVHYVIGSIITQKSDSAIRVLPSVSSTAFPVFMGNTVTGEDTGGSSYDVTDTRYSCEIIGNYLESLSTNACLYLGAANPGSAQTMTITGNLCKCTSSSTMLNVTGHANIGGYIQNNIFEAGTSNGAISCSSSGGAWTFTSNYIRRTNTVTNWDTRFPTQLWADIVAGTVNGNTASTTAAGIGSDFKPNASGNCDNEGTTPGWYGGMDMYGRPLYLGGTYTRGCVEIQAKRTGAMLFPLAW